MLLHWQAPSVGRRLGNERAPSPWVPAARSRAWTCASLPDPASRTQEARASQPSETKWRPRGCALAHLTLRPQHGGLYPERACSPAHPRDQLIHGGRGLQAEAGLQGGE